MVRLAQIKPRLGTLDWRTGRIVQPMTAQEAEAERRRRYDEDRANDQIRALYRTARWRQLRRDLYVERGGRCQCGCGRLTVLHEREATAAFPVAVFDHRDDARKMVQQGGPEAFFDRSRIDLLAKPCHDAKTAKEQGFARR